MRRYKAFISYSHRDRDIARKLHRKLETWRVPARLVGQKGEHGEIPARLAPVFCDREELTAADDLASRVNAAIADSEFLIVLCSPAAAASPWVNKEILAFKLAHGEARILCVIADGEPFASDRPEEADRECFPRALRYRLGEDGAPGDRRAEPIAADLRDIGDGWNGAFLKLAAGMLGIGLDTLVRREEQRHRRRLTLITAAASAGMLVMGFLTLQAIESRQAAETQRHAAEGLIEFMLDDLRRRLEPVGRLDVLDVVGQRALAYYAAQSADRLDPASLGRRSRALHLIGEIASLRGNLDEALATFEEAAATTAELLSREPEDERRLFDHAQSVFWVGYIAWQRGDRTRAREEFGQYKALAGQLTALAPENPDWLAELGYAESNLGTLALGEGQLDAAREAFENALAAFDEVARAAPDDPQRRFDLAQANAWLADVEERGSRFSEAAARRRTELGIYENILDADPHNAVALQAMPVTWQALGRLAVAQGEGELALTSFKTANRLSARLLETEPDNTLWREIAVGGHLRFAETLADLGMFAGAREEVEAGRTLLAPLGPGNAGADVWSRLAYLLHYVDALVTAGAGETEVAMALARRAVEGFASLHTGHFERDLARMHCEAELLLGRLLWESGDEDAARDRWRSGLAALEGAPRPLPPTELTTAAALRWQLGEERDARDLVASAPEFWRHPRFVRLSQTMAMTEGATTTQENRPRKAAANADSETK